MNVHSINSQRANYVLYARLLNSARAIDRSKLFAILLIIKFSPVPESQYFLSDLRKPFYKECLIYMHGFDESHYMFLEIQM